LGPPTGNVDPTLAYWTHSGNLVFMTLLGGFTHFYGPLLGAFVFIYLQDFVMSLVPYWRLIFGALLALIVIFAPTGLMGLITRGRAASAYRWRLAFIAFLVGAGLVPGMTASAQVPLRTEILSIDSITLTRTDFLTGVTTGPPVRIAGYLTVPRAAARAPAVVMMHGGSGIRANAKRWTDELNARGMAVFLVDSFGGRGITDTQTDPSRLVNEAMVVDAFRALGLLARHPQIDPDHIAVMGFSKGGFVALYSSLRRFQRMHGPQGRSFAAHVALYPPCQWRFINDEDVADRPIRIFHGEADDWTPIAPCREYVERLRRAGKDAALTAYPGAHHGFDSHLAPPSLWLPNVLRGPKCDFRERADGTMTFGDTGQPFGLNHPCVERGATIGYHPEAHRNAVVDVTSFLQTVLWRR
jgi:dienelactone hydrolase